MTTTTLASLRTEHAALRARYHAIEAELAALVDACHRGEVEEDAAWYATVDALLAEQYDCGALEEAMRPAIHQITREQAEADDNAEIVRVRKVNLRAFEKGLDSSVDTWTSLNYPENTCRAGVTWIEGPRGLLAEMVGACEETLTDNISETAAYDWSVSTPLWMVEKNIEAMIAAADLACRKISEQL